MKQPKSEPVYICSVCGKDIAGDHVYISKQGEEQSSISIMGVCREEGGIAMERLTHPRSSGIKTGYWSPNKKDELIERLAAYEDTDLTPQEIYSLKAGTILKEQHRWIPVEERLPEESLNSVIGWDKYRERCCFVQYYAGSWHLGDESVRIIAWMPLPEPYQGK